VRTKTNSRGGGLSVAEFRGRHRTITTGDLEFLVALQILFVPNKGNLESGVFHGTGHTEHNKIKTLRIFQGTRILAITASPNPDEPTRVAPSMSLSKS